LKPHDPIHSADLLKAARDFHYLLNQGYPRKPSLELVGNRHQLSFDQRHLLHRGIFSDVDARARRKRQVSFRNLNSRNLAIDGYNVLITLDAALSTRPLILSNDGFIRDISGLSGDFKKTKVTEDAIHLIFGLLVKVRPAHTLFLFDSPISKSGLLAQELRERLESENLAGDALALKVPEKILLGFHGIVATSDRAVIDQSHEVFDLAGALIKRRIRPVSLVKLNLSE